MEQTDTNLNTQKNKDYKDYKDYEEEQIQQILINESEKQKLIMDRELKAIQDEEYKRSLEFDLLQTQKDKKTTDDFESISTEAMRQIRLLRFDTK